MSTPFIPENASRRTMARRGLMMGLLLIPLYIVTDYLGGPGRAGAAYLFAAMMITAILASWRHRLRPWFWPTIVVVTAAHVLLIVKLTWPDRSFPAPELWPVGIADLAVICGLIKLAEKLFGSPDAGSAEGGSGQ